MAKLFSEVDSNLSGFGVDLNSRYSLGKALVWRKHWQVLLPSLIFVAEPCSVGINIGYLFYFGPEQCQSSQFIDHPPLQNQHQAHFLATRFGADLNFGVYFGYLVAGGLFLYFL